MRTSRASLSPLTLITTSTHVPYYPTPCARTHHTHSEQVSASAVKAPRRVGPGAGSSGGGSGTGSGQPRAPAATATPGRAPGARRVVFDAVSEDSEDEGVWCVEGGPRAPGTAGPKAKGGRGKGHDGASGSQAASAGGGSSAAFRGAKGQALRDRLTQEAFAEFNAGPWGVMLVCGGVRGSACIRERCPCTGVWSSQ